MSLVKKIKIFIICIVVVCVGYSLVSQGDLTNSYTNNANNTQVNKDQEMTTERSIFAVNFIDPKISKDKSLENGISYLRRVSESAVPNSSHNRYNLELSKANINFDESVVSVYIESHTTNESGYGSSLIINDGFYLRNNLAATESISENVETIFVTDNVMNQLISCRENKGIYKCHTAVSNLNEPQDILVVNNYIYIVNSHEEGESGDITRCKITNQGYIDSCGQERVNIINPVFFYYNPPNINISGFEYSGSGRAIPLQAIQCTLDAKGDFINCNPDYQTLSAFYYSKYYNGSYYRTHSGTTNSYIDKCASIDATRCISMPNEHLVYPLSLSINQDKMFISNAKPANIKPDILKCSMDMSKCDVVTNSIISPMCIGVFNFKRTSDGA
ncbi:hypothetical protein [Aquella oligotrophica]|uniref:Uncharacterized protein n=1 Tax=Aquella oligotrophica TaxID=2067065 RepID=A0A2I7N5C6_9NEIS|nr:hypothetical protein [Aquella oligotrophica]AUR51667.1 hypothetical protein CUN60_04960 [Aquella oligotrophica]